MNNSEQNFESFKKQKLHISLLTYSHIMWNLRKSHCNSWSKTISRIWKYSCIHFILSEEYFKFSFSKLCFMFCEKFRE